MSDKIVKDLEIKNIKGLHARAAAAFVKTLERGYDKWLTPHRRLRW